MTPNREGHMASHIARRKFLATLGGAAAAWPLAARAQQGERVRRIGVLITLAEDDPEAKAWVAGFLQGLAKRGWSEDRNLHIDYRFALAGAQVQVLAKELISTAARCDLCNANAGCRCVAA